MKDVKELRRGSGCGQVAAASALLLAGLVLILAVPTHLEGPMLLYIDEEHAIRLMDAAGLMLAIPAWLALNLIAVARMRARQDLLGL